MKMAPYIWFPQIPIGPESVVCRILLREPRNMESIVALCDAIGHDWYTDPDCEMNFCARCGHMEGD